MSGRTAATVSLVAAGLAVVSWKYGNGDWKLLLSAWLYTAVGLFAWWRRPEHRVGKLLLLVAAAIWLAPAEETYVPLLWTIGSALEPLWLPSLAYLLLSFPNGRLTRERDRLLVAVASTIVASSVIGSFFFDPRDSGCKTCQPDLNLILVESSPPEYVRTWLGLLAVLLTVALLVAAAVRQRNRFSAPTRRALAAAGFAAALVLVALAFATGSGEPLRQGAHILTNNLLYLLVLLALTGSFVHRWVRATGPARRVLTPMLLPASAFFLAVATQSTIGWMLGIWIFSPQPWIYTFLTDVATWASISLPLSFLLALWLAWARRGRVGELMAELGKLPAPEKLEYALARALGDASLTVGRWDPARRSYVTAGGADLELPPEGGDRVVTFLEQEGTPLAAVVHDAALLEDRPMLDSVTAVARLAVDNERLQAELRAQLEEVRASRLRIVAAADVGRRRVERDLHDGAQQRLVSIALAAKMTEAQLLPDADPALKASLRAISDELAGALEELRELARGIHPSVLTEDGLGPALQSLAERSTVPARIVAAPNRRFPAPVEAAVYFVVAEALANAGKHAHASHVTMGVSQANGRLLVEVADDGVGGADPRAGSGLNGLADRVAAVDGQLEVESAPGSGTRVLAEIPCASS